MLNVSSNFMTTKEQHWDFAGILFGMVGCIALANQIYYELQQVTSSLSTAFVGSFFFIYLFWFLYGLRFKRPAIIITNSISLLLQTILFFITIVK